MYKKQKVIVARLDSMAYFFWTYKTIKKLSEENIISYRVIIRWDGETISL